VTISDYPGQFGLTVLNVETRGWWSCKRYCANRGCVIQRFNADELETAVWQAIVRLIEQPVSEFLATRHQGTGARPGELASINRQQGENSAVVDRYFRVTGLA
jgi:hypothetical protein